MSLDISSILKDWPYEAGQVTARRIQGDDGRDKIQLRLDLGLYQMEATGRPDGERPHGLESQLDYQEQKLQRYKQERGSDEGFEVDPAACEQLRAEGVMYYHRYLALFVLEDFEAVERDTMRNMRMMDFCRRYARDESDRMAMEQFRPYVIMMCTRARALLAFRQDRPAEAMDCLRAGMEGVRKAYRDRDQSEADSHELSVLRAMIREIEQHLPMDPARKLRKALSQAVREERYEDAANLRDKLRDLTGEIPTDEEI